MKDSDFELIPQNPGTEEGILTKVLEGEIRSFPGNISVTQYFQNGFTDGRIATDNRALIEEEKHTTFKELDDISTKLAIVIRNLLGGDNVQTANPDKDIVIGVCLPPSQKLIFSLFAILKLGGAYLPFDNSFPENRIIKIVEGARPLMIISDSHGPTISKFHPVIKNTKVISVEDLISLAETESSNDGVKPFPGHTVPAERTAIILYTSGSSGEPKGVRLNHRTVMNRLNWQWQTFPYISDERCCFKTALTFVDSVPEILGPLLMGHSVTVYAKTISTHPNYLIQRIADDKITRIVLVPSLLRAILHTIEILGRDKSKELLKTVVLWVCSGETLPKDLLMEVFEKFPSGTVLANFYGSTEIMGDVTYETFRSIKDVQEKTYDVHVPIGRAVYNTIVYILDPKMGVVPEGESGEIYIAGYNLTSGYVGIPNSDKLVDNPYSKAIGFNRLFKTGDFARIGKPTPSIRTLFYEGRVDSQIKIRGFRVDLGEIEAGMRAQTELIEKVVVLCYHAGLPDQALIAFVIPKPGVSQGQINAMLKVKLRPYEIPELRIITEVPLLVNGKVDRQRLLKAFEDERTSSTPYKEWHLLNMPEEQLTKAKALVEVLSEVTGTSQHAIVDDLDDSFFNLGGTSLNSITVIMKLRQRNFQIPIGDFVAAKSINEIIGKIQLCSINVDVPSVSNEAENIYTSETLKIEHEKDVVPIIAYSFSHRGDLEKYTLSTYEDFVTLIRSVWHELVQKGYSFAIRRNENRKIVAVALNFDVYDEPEKLDASKGIQYVFDFLEFVEGKQREKLPKGKNKLWHSFMMGTHEEVDDSENVYLITYMEEENIRLAKQNQFIGIMTTNTNPLTQQICEELQGYEVLTDYQVNQYEAPDGTKPFGIAPDSQKAVCCWKKL